MHQQPSILIVDDDPVFRGRIARHFQAAYKVMECASLENLDQIIPSIPFLNVALIDLQLDQDEKGGFKAIAKLRAHFPHVKFIVITENGTAKSAIDALTTYDVEKYIEKQQFKLQYLELLIAMTAKMVPRIFLCHTSDTKFFAELLNAYLAQKFNITIVRQRMSKKPEERIAQIKKLIQRREINTILAIQSPEWETNSEQEEILQLVQQQTHGCRIIGIKTSKNLQQEQPIHEYFHQENTVDFTFIFERIKDFVEDTSNLNNILLQRLREGPVEYTEMLTLFQKRCEILIKSYLHIA